MLKTLLATLQCNIRRVRSSKIDNYRLQAAANKMQFTEYELLNMGLRYPDRKISIVKSFKQKYYEKRHSYTVYYYLDESVSEDPQPSMYKKVKKNLKDKFKHFRLRNARRKVRTPPGSPELLSYLSRIRMGEQYLPLDYLKQVQKIFHKYGHKQLRDIALHFNKFVRLRYSEYKINYDDYADLKFKRLEQKLFKDKQVYQIYLIGKPALFEYRETETKRKADDEPIEPEINYTQNIVIAYLINRVPRTYAAAKRVFTEIHRRFPAFKPRYFIDFGSGLSSGSLSSLEVFNSLISIMNVYPSTKMRKLSKYLTSHTNIQHYYSLGELSSRLVYADLVYAGYVLHELRSELVEVYLYALFAKVSDEGFLVLIEHGNPFGSRLLHYARKWAIAKKGRIIAPCPHDMPCPLARYRFWCHFDQSSGMYPRYVFGKLPTDNAIQLEKFAYLVIQKPKGFVSSAWPEELTKEEYNRRQYEQNKTYEYDNIDGNYNEKSPCEEWDRVLFPLVKRGRHFLMTVCTKTGRFEKRIVSYSHGLYYKYGRKLKWGDFWRFGKRIPNKYRKYRRTGKRLW